MQRLPKPFLPLLLMTLAATNSSAQTRPSTDAAEHWVAAWTSPQQRVYPNIAPPAPGLSNATLRQIIRASIAGKRVRVRLANDFGTADLRVAAVHLARPTSLGAIDVTTDVAVTFAGQPGAAVPAGSSLLSDPVDFAVLALGDVAVTMRLDSVVNADITEHPGARCTSFVVAGDAVSAATWPGAATSEHWYFLSGLDVVATTDAQAAVVALGDSITDGRGSTTDGNGRWTDALAVRMQANDATRGVTVLNAGIGGNRVLHDGLGPSALARFDRDVLAPAGARWLIVLEGVNDLGTAKPADVADVGRALIAGYAQMIERAHARGMRVIGGTITPFAGSQCDTPEREAARQATNVWIREAGHFDDVADFDVAARDPSAPTHLAAPFDSGDHLHLNDAGYRRLAEAVDLTMFATPLPAGGPHP